MPDLGSPASHGPTARSGSSPGHRLALRLCLLFAVVLGGGFRPERLAASELAAAVVCAEARGEGSVAMAAVWEVIHTRTQERRLTADQVVRQRRQFACLNRVAPARLIARMKRTEQWPQALALVSTPPQTRHAAGANHFTRLDEHPPWMRGRKPVAVIGAHGFYRFPTQHDRR